MEEKVQNVTPTLPETPTGVQPETGVQQSVIATPVQPEIATNQTPNAQPEVTVNSTANVQSATTTDPTTIIQPTAPVSKETNVQPAANTALEKKKSNAKIGIIIGVVCAVIVVLFLLIAIIAIALLTRKPTINLNDFTNVVYEGYDGIGNATVEIDYLAIKEKYDKRLKIKKKYEDDIPSAVKNLEDLKSRQGIAFLEIYAKPTLDKSDYLSNEDSVNVSWDVDTEMLQKYLNVKIKYKDFESKVNGLEEIETFDPFEELTVNYTGFAPNGMADVRSGSAYGYYISYNPDKTEGLSNGDVITVTVNLPYGEESFVKSYKKLPSVYEKEYTVEGLPSYLSSASEISSEIMDKMKKQAEDIIVSRTPGAQNCSEMEVVSADYIGNYFNVIKPGVYDSYGNNHIYLIYKLHYKGLAELNNKDRDEEEREFDLYYCVEFWDIIDYPTEGQNVNLTDYAATTHRAEPFSDWGDLWFGFSPATALGYNTLDEIYQFAVIDRVENYNCEKNIEE